MPPWNGSTRLAFDQLIIPRSAWRPFIGLNIGGVYGDINYHKESRDGAAWYRPTAFLKQPMPIPEDTMK
jgi:hypothetical protein